MARPLPPLPLLMAWPLVDFFLRLPLPLNCFMNVKCNSAKLCFERLEQILNLIQHFA